MLRGTEEKRDHSPGRPNPILYALACFGFRLGFLFRNIKYVYHFEKTEFRGKQVILLSDHAVSDSYAPIFAAWQGDRLNPVVSRKYCSARLTRLLCTLLGGIPKNNFRNDLRSMRQMLSVLKNGGSLLLFPEGTASNSGSSHPLFPGTVTLLKKAGVPVVLARSYGYYLTHPFYSEKRRKGPVEIHFELLFTPEELREKDKDALYEKLLSRFRYNDFEWNEAHHYRYVSKSGNAAGLEQLLYLCPSCGRESTMRTEGRDIFCAACGNRIRVEDDYRLVPAPGSVLPYRSIDEWYKAERRRVREEIENPDFHIDYDCRISCVSEKSLRAVYPDSVVGQGHIRIDAAGVSYVGTIRGEPAERFFPIAELPSFFLNRKGLNCLFDGDNWCGFEPLSKEVNPSRNRFAVEELHNRVDPAWDRVSRDAYDA